MKSLNRKPVARSTRLLVGTPQRSATADVKTSGRDLGWTCLHDPTTSTRPVSGRQPRETREVLIPKPLPLQRGSALSERWAEVPADNADVALYRSLGKFGDDAIENTCRRMRSYADGRDHQPVGVGVHVPLGHCELQS